MYLRATALPLLYYPRVPIGGGTPPYSYVIDKRVYRGAALVARVLPILSNPSVLELVNDALDTCTVYGREPGTCTATLTFEGEAVEKVFTVV